jgi:hypothetical protein
MEHLNLNKTAAPAWTKMLQSLSANAVERLRTGLPSTVARQVGKAELGRGAEGKVMNAFVGQHGPATVKTFYDRPAFNALNHPVPEIGQVTGGAEGIQQGLGSSIAKKLDVMRHFPDVFPKILGEQPRGYFMEKLKPIHTPAEGEGLTFRDEIRNTITKYRAGQANQAIRGQLIQDNSANPWWKKLLGMKSEAELDPAAHNKLVQTQELFGNQLNDQKGRIGKLFADRNVGTGAASHPLFQLHRRLKRLSAPHTNPLTDRQVDLTSNGNSARVMDFWHNTPANEVQHNIMQAPDGRAVISDPVVQGSLR